MIETSVYTKNKDLFYLNIQPAVPVKEKCCNFTFVHCTFCPVNAITLPKLMANTVFI